MSIAVVSIGTSFRYSARDDEYHLLGQILREKGEDQEFKSAVQIARHLTLTAWLEEDSPGPARRRRE
ncbi:hypothetical protein [Nitrobacter winogradskyi]|uniref:Uncharacterized protein n=2 Tax=Nitrobacter winogradskyi TaxID=913 RepID=A0ACC6AIF4_NITWI|nr:hypothetical protein [Nitrobacter winogradskyi]MCP1999149.1 hypothetical protein [Nitrobacter winogradskyi]GEC16909.1 hypothetical protein NWI01_28010 [Nitrobacter winogradskyi]